MDKLSHSPNAERKDTGLFARRKRPRRKRWLYVLRCRLVLMAALQAMNAIILVAENVAKLWQLIVTVVR